MIACLRHFNIKFAVYSPLAGGFLVGHLLSPEALSSVEPSTPFGMYFQKRYAPIIDPVRELRDVAVRTSSCLSSPYDPIDDLPSFLAGPFMLLGM